MGRELLHPALDFSQSSFPARQQTALIDKCREYAGTRGVYAIVRRRFLPSNSTTPRPEFGRFVITDASLAVGETVATGTFFNVKDNGVRCFAAPCPSVIETRSTSAPTRRHRGRLHTRAAARGQGRVMPRGDGHADRPHSSRAIATR